MSLAAIDHDRAPDTLEPDDDDPCDHAPIHARLDRMDATLTDHGKILSEVRDSVGPAAQRHRARRESAVLTAAVACVGCLGVGALDLAGASDVTVGLVAGIVVLGVATVGSIVGRGSIRASVAGASIQAGGDRDTTEP